jgi:flagellar hook-basal body complex protein FliE
LQRTDPHRAPKDRNMAEKEPSKFAALLIERLQSVKEEQDKVEKMRESLHTIEVHCPPIDHVD